MVSNYREYTQIAIENFKKKDTASRNLLVDAVKDKLPKMVLDVGCGAGQDLLPFLEKTDAFCVGVDWGKELGEVTRDLFKEQKIYGKYGFLRAMGEELPFADGSFDVVLCRVALPFMDNRKTISEFSRILKLNGTLLLKTQTPAFYFKMIKDRAKTLNPKLLAYPLICLLLGIFHSITGKTLRTGIWKGKEIYQTNRFIEKECARNGLTIRGFLADNNRQTPSFVIIKTM